MIGGDSWATAIVKIFEIAMERKTCVTVASENVALTRERTRNFNYLQHIT